MSKKRFMDYIMLSYGTDSGLKRKRRIIERVCEKLSIKAGLEYKVSTIENMRCLKVRPKGEYDDGKLVFYCHGGGYNSGGIGYMKLLSGKLSVALNCQVFAHEYSLSPEKHFPCALEETFRIWKYLMDTGIKPEGVILVGDSAGGNMALELCLRLKQKGMPMPGKLILLSPWTDMTMTGKSYEIYKGRDPILSSKYIKMVRAYYAPDADYKNPELSPVYGDVTDFPKTLIQVGEIEMLRSDSERLYKKMKRSGVDVSIHMYLRGWHVFQQMPIRKSRVAFMDIKRFVEGKA